MWSWSWLAEEGRLEKSSRGRFALVESVRRLYAHASSTAAGRGEVEGLAAARARLAAANADEAERRGAETRGELVPLSTIKPFWTAKLQGVRNRLRHIPKAGAQRIPGFTTAMVRPLQALIDEALRELSGDGIPPRRKRRRRA